MPLPEEYLRYPHRSAGMDQDRYAWEMADRRAPVHLASGAKAMLVFVVPLEFFPLNPPTAPFKHPGAMVTPYPDLRHYTTRDYGNRVGVYRLLRAFAAAEVNATFAINAAVAKRYPPLLAALTEGGHEVAAHGVSTAHIHHAGLSEADERALVAETREVFPQARTWMSPARNQSFATPDLVREAGFDLCLDWETDQRPIAMRTAHGPLTCLPHHTELSDFTLLQTKGHSETEWVEQIVEAARFVAAEHDTSGAGALGVTLTPYITGQPFRIAALRTLLDTLTALDGLAIATAAETADAFAMGAEP